MFFKTVPTGLQTLADHCAAELHIRGADKNLQIEGASALESAGTKDLAFLDKSKYLDELSSTKAGVVICAKKHADAAPKTTAVLVHAKPYEAYGKLLALIYPTAARPQPITGETGISPKAVLAPDAVLEEGVIVEANAVIGSGAQIGAGTHILVGAVIGPHVKIGRNCVISCNTTVVHALIGDDVVIHNGVQIGQDGFGFAMGPGGHAKVCQIGRVIIQDSVEVGANTTVDRGANRDTVIGEGTKIDNLVQIGHNSVIGRHCVIVGLAGISGSATLGDYVVIAGQVGVVGHTKVGDGAQIGGGSGVHGDVPPGARMMGYPAIDARTWMREASKTVLADRKKRKGKEGA